MSAISELRDGEDRLVHLGRWTGAHVGPLSGGGMPVRKKHGHLRVLIDEGRSIVDFVMDDNIDVLLCRVLGHFGVGEFFRHA